MSSSTIKSQDSLPNLPLFFIATSTFLLEARFLLPRLWRCNSDQPMTAIEVGMAIDSSRECVGDSKPDPRGDLGPQPREALSTKCRPLMAKRFCEYQEEVSDDCPPFADRGWPCARASLSAGHSLSRDMVPHCVTVRLLKQDVAFRLLHGVATHSPQPCHSKIPSQSGSSP